MHIGLMNNMPDAALEPTERQFLRLIGGCNRIAQFHIYPFSPPQVPRGTEAREHIEKYYYDFDQLKEEGLDALIVSGANPVCDQLPDEAFWDPMCEVLDWAVENVTSTLCACLATHAAFLHFHGIERQPLPAKRWGVFPHRVVMEHPLVRGINTRFDVPHSRWNDISPNEMNQADQLVLVESPDAGVHLATSADGLRLVFFQGHPEYDSFSLLKEYKREVTGISQARSKIIRRIPTTTSWKMLKRYWKAFVRKQNTRVQRAARFAHFLKKMSLWITPGGIREKSFSTIGWARFIN